MGENKIINTDFLSSIANAIRSKLGTSDPISIANMPSSIESIPSGGESKLPSVIDKSVTTLTASDLSGATKIGDYAFYNCNSLTSVTLPNTVTQIKDYAFANCSVLNNFTIPSSVLSLGGHCFTGCIGLTSVVVPNSITTISDYIFQNCTGLTSITFNNNKDIPTSICSGCSNLTTVTINGSPSVINNSAFYNCKKLTTINIPDSVKSILPSAFQQTGLTSLPTMNNVTQLGQKSFANTPIEEFEIPPNVITLGQYCFASCENLKTIKLNNNKLSIIPKYCFQYCKNIKTIYLDTKVDTIDSYAFLLTSYTGEGMTIKVYRTTPPTLYTSSLPSANYVTKVYVPADAITTYEGITGWSAYKGKYEALPDWNDEYAEMEKNYIIDSKDVEEPIEEIINEEDE